MAKPKEPINPFYIVLAALGVIFFVTAAAYWQMASRAIDFVPQAEQAPHPLMTFMESYGMHLMAGELVLLGIATCAAMWLDQYRSHRAEKRERGSEELDNGSKSGHKIS